MKSQESSPGRRQNLGAASRSLAEAAKEADEASAAGDEVRGRPGSREGHGDMIDDQELFNYCEQEINAFIDEGGGSEEGREAAKALMQASGIKKVKDLVHVTAEDLTAALAAGEANLGARAVVRDTKKNTKNAMMRSGPRCSKRCAKRAFPTTTYSVMV